MTTDVDEELTIDLGSQRVPPTAEMRRWIRTCLPWLSEEIGYDLQLVCTELIANAYEHGAMPGWIHIEPVGQRIRVEVHDASRRMPVMRRQPKNSRRGRGLRIVDRLASAWGVVRTRTGKTVWAELSTSRSPT